ncbi:hypothetical protein [Streptomyces zaomyceticus]|uniref:hypothetical protein n=1 Tax=Streptomyces zaomyceticus TaxID=68286 RepID=UPI00342198D5
MTNSFRIDRILGDRPFAEVGDPVLAVDDVGRGLLAVAGAHVPVAGMHEFGITAPVGVYGTGDLVCRALLHEYHPVHAMAFHPGLPLLAVGTGDYDGGYFFEGGTSNAQDLWISSFGGRAKGVPSRASDRQVTE